LSDIADAVLGVEGRFITLADLPPPDTRRWSPRYKAIVVAAVCGGLLALDVACARYSLSVEEFASWQRKIGRLGLEGLRASHRESRHRAEDYEPRIRFRDADARQLREGL
jgi:hypothetical protein